MAPLVAHGKMLANGDVLRLEQKQTCEDTHICTKQNTPSVHHMPLCFHVSLPQHVYPSNVAV